MTPPAPAHRPRVLEPGDPAWPPLLPESVEQPVEQLWVIGRDPPTLGPCLAIVGARNCNAYGLEVAHSLAADLAVEGVCIVSGLARGIDGAAHEGALSVGGSTIAVLAGGVDRPYPAASRRLYDRIAETGALLSERSLGFEAHKHDFRRRNRIIAAISHAVVVVQGAIRPGGRTSGALITANAAAELGRGVLAVPGDIGSILSTGPHQLLRDHAWLCTRASDVFDRCPELLPATRSLLERPIPEGLPDDERAVLEAIMVEPGRADGVARHTGLDLLTASRLLTRLELKGWLRRASAGIYQRVR